MSVQRYFWAAQYYLDVSIDSGATYRLGKHPGNRQQHVAGVRHPMPLAQGML